MSTNGTAPYGWTVDEDGKIVEDAGEQAVLDAIRERTRGRLIKGSPADIAEHLNRLGFRNRAGRPFERTGALRLIRAMRQREQETATT
jgi:hypothetical protein